MAFSRGRVVRRRRNYSRYANGLGAAYSIGRKIATRFGQSYTRTRTKRRHGRSGGGVTSHYDRNTVYRRKPMPRFRQKRYVRQVRKINHIIDLQKATQVIVRNGSDVYNVQMGQTWCETWLYGIAGNAAVEMGTNDVGKILENQMGSSSGDFRYRFESAVLDLTFSNVSYPYESSNPDNPDNGSVAKLEVDVYEMIVIGEIEESTALNMYTNLATQTPIIPGATDLTLDSRGTSPFTWTTSAKYIRVIKKTKYFLGAGQTFTYQIRDPKNRSVSTKDVEALFGHWGKPYMTRGVVVVFKIVAPVTDGETAQTGRLSMASTRQYNYVIPDVRPIQDGGLL